MESQAESARSTGKKGVGYLPCIYSSTLFSTGEQPCLEGLYKLSMTVGLTRPEGHEIARRLVTMSDVIVENNRA
jgi:hypothetical protein